MRVFGRSKSMLKGHVEMVQVKFCGGVSVRLDAELNKGGAAEPDLRAALEMLGDCSGKEEGL